MNNSQHSIVLENLINQFARLPGVGKKSARRLAYHIIRIEKDKAINISNAIIDAKDKLNFCQKCYNLTENDLCNICSQEKRDDKKILVVENYHDLYLFENLHIYNGLYHVLGGVLNPLEGIGPNSLKLEELFTRINKEDISEIIIGLNHSIEGDSTSLYINNHLTEANITITRLARGIPVGGEIEYTDEITLKQSFENRKELE